MRLNQFRLSRSFNRSLARDGRMISPVATALKERITS
jgi:hypothetical protein